MVGSKDKAEGLSVQAIIAALDDLRVAELREIAVAAESRIQEKSEGERRSFIEETLNKAKALGLSVTDLFGETTPPVKRRGRGPAKPKPEGTKVAAKFRGPAGQEWSGRGRRPIWAQGLSDEQLQEYAISNPAAA
jgi:DNA-binding protein H-NS